MSDHPDARLGAADLLDTPPEVAFDRITRLVGKLIGVPVALVSILDSDRQFFKSAHGLPEPWRTRRETPLTHSFCQHVVSTEAPLVVGVARDHPLVRDNLAIPDLGVEAYLGMPIHAPDGTVIGSLCAIDTVRRAWTEDEQETMTDFVDILETELALREEVGRRRLAEAGKLLLMREMEHRVKNSFAKVQAIVSLSMRHGRDLKTVRQAVTQRIASLAKTQSLFVEATGRSTSLSAVLRNELEPYDAQGKLSLTGAPVALVEEQAIVIAMVVHELGTNAAKYGAFRSGGRIAVDWAERQIDGQRRLRLEWLENGGQIDGGPAADGFGATLLDALIVRQHKGRIDREWRTTGLRLVADFELTPIPDHV
jgi:two-component sensor histidine kinase